jgi:hypothetical protein
MTAYGFKARFCQPCIDGTKGGTIRAPRRDGRLIKVGGMIQFYTGARTSQCRKIMPDLPCLDVQPVELFLNYGGVVIANIGMKLTRRPQVDAFARFDGFPDWDALREFWREEHGGLERFSGFHTRWLPWPKVLVP